MPAKLTVPCPICGADSVATTNHSPSAYWRCEDCGSAHLHPTPTPEFLFTFYERFHQPDANGGVYEQFEQRTAADFPHKGKTVATFLRESKANGSSRVLDVGCGKGFFVAELQKHGYRVEGIDLSATAVDQGTRQGIAGLHQGRVEERADWTTRYDAVTCWATIEHLLDPAAFVIALCRVLKPGGLLFMDTGVGNDFVDRHAPGFVQWYDPPQHIFVFSRSGMTRLLRKAGFETLHFDVNFERSPARRMMKLTRNRVLAAAGGLLFRSMLGRTTFDRMRRETKMPFGSLMLVVARKRA